jgi:putative redox protein
VSRASLVLDTVESGLRFRATLEGGARVVFDDVKGGPDPNPVLTVLAALGACTGMDVIAILRKKRQVVMGYEIELDGERRTEHPRIFTKIVVVHRLRGRDLDPRAIADAIRLSETKYCSVHGMLSGVAGITSRFEIVPA